MFSKSLFKQSCKANGVMWLVITIAVCFTLSCVMLISGNGSISETKRAIQNTIIEGELTSSIEGRSIFYYETGAAAMERFDSTFTESYAPAYMKLLQTGCPENEAAAKASMAAYAAAVEDIQKVYIPAINAENGYLEGSSEADELKGIIFYVLNPMQADGSFMFDDYYINHGEEPMHYTDLLSTITEANHTDEREKYVMHNCSVFLADNLVKEESIAAILDTLSNYGVTEKQYIDFGFADYSKIKQIAKETIVDYRATMEFRLDSAAGHEVSEEVRSEVRKSVTGSLLSSLPQEVADALDEIGQMDMYGTLVGTIFFKMAGLLLPIIYMIMTANALIAGQVDSGSMAYILASSTKRRTVTFTQAIYLIGSLFAMFVCTAITSIICMDIVEVDTELTWKTLILINLGAFLVMFAMSGICFLSSCWFDRSKNSMALGGGLSMFFLVATMLGLFGSEVMPSILRMKALNYFNYASIITLFDTSSILEGTTEYAWKFVILIAVGFVCYITGAVRFRKKDLPL